MSKPSKPKTPEHEKAAMRLHAQLGEYGSGVVAANGAAFVDQVTKDRATAARGRSSADAAMASASQRANHGSNPMQIAQSSMAGSSGQAQALTAGTAAGVGAEGNAAMSGGQFAAGASAGVANSATQLSAIQNKRNMQQSAANHQTMMGVLDLGGAIGGYYMGGTDFVQNGGWLGSK